MPGSVRGLALEVDVGRRLFDMRPVNAAAKP